MISDTQKLIIITAPSGSGKTTIVHHLLNTNPQLAFSVSACTRQPRPNEKDGVHYYFLSLEQFTRKSANHEFAEFEMVYEGKYYGTLKAELQRIWDAGKTPLVDIDVQGALRLKKHYGEQALSIFVKAPSLEILKQRLIDRGTETDFTLAERLDKAGYETTFAENFDRIIVNDELQKACAEASQEILLFLS
ncbi:MAG: guanylate kinase [Bacteroidetes bacterium]|nr:guanylate kinase [Bacteroidota bacterium]